METDQKTELKKNILGKIDSLKADIAAFKAVTKPVSPDSAIGRLTRMEAINSKSINEAALEKAKATMSSLERALARIDDPDFGLCCECEEPIAPARLMALPETELCIRCAEKISR
jgi:DnaK suppressor protein